MNNLLVDANYINSPSMDNGELPVRLSDNETIKDLEDTINAISIELNRLYRKKHKSKIDFGKIGSLENKKAACEERLRIRKIELNNESIAILLIESAFLLNKSIFINDKGETIPKKCSKCGSNIGVFIYGEPIYRCKNKECNKFYGVVKFSKK